MTRYAKVMPQTRTRDPGLPSHLLTLDKGNENKE